MSEPTMLAEDEEVLGDPSFEMWIRDGEPVVSGSYFMHPPLRAKNAQWDPNVADRLVVQASDGSQWFAENVPHAGSVTVCLRPVGG